MSQPEFKEPLFFVHPHGLYLAGAELALPGLKMIVDRQGLSSTIALLQDQAIQAELPAGAQILLMKPAPKIEFLAREHGWHLVAVSSVLNRRFENKLSIVTGFVEAGLPILPFEILTPKGNSFEAVSKRLGKKLVAQTERGHAGSSSRIVEGESDWRKLIDEQGDYETKLMPFVEGDTWTLNACVTRYGTLVSRPFFQLQNLPECGELNPLATCGNWHRDIDDDLAEDISAYAEAFGDALHKAGYLGWFGLDLLVSEGRIAGFIECNPRLTASTGIFTKMQVKAGQTPMLLLHILELLGREYEIDLLAEQEKLNQGFHEYHVVLRNASDKETPCPNVESQAGVEVISRSPSIPIPPGEPYAIRVSDQPFESGVA